MLTTDAKTANPDCIAQYIFFNSLQCGIPWIVVLTVYNNEYIYIWLIRCEPTPFFFILICFISSEWFHPPCTVHPCRKGWRRECAFPVLAGSPRGYCSCFGKAGQLGETCAYNTYIYIIIYMYCLFLPILVWLYIHYMEIFVSHSS